MLLEVQSVNFLLLLVVGALRLALRVLQQLVAVQASAHVLLRAHQVLFFDILGRHVRVLLGGLGGVVLLQLLVEEVDVIQLGVNRSIHRSGRHSIFVEGRVGVRPDSLHEVR